MITVPEPLRSRLLSLIEDVDTARGEIDRIRNAQATTSEEHIAIGSSLNFRERRFGGMFGGDKEKVRRHRRLAEQVQRLGFALLSQQALISSNEEQIARLLDQELLRDPAYKALCAVYEDGVAVQEAGQRLIHLINKFLREVGTAQSVNLVGVSAVSMYDWLLKESLLGYQASIEKFLGVKGAGSTIHTLQEFLELLAVTDIVIEFGVDDFQIEDVERHDDPLPAYRAKARAVTDQVAAVLERLAECRTRAQNELRARL